MKLLLWNPLAIGLLMLMMLGQSVRAQRIKSPPNMFEEFSQVWKEDEWQPPGAARRTGYMRPLDDRGWKNRMLAFRSLIVTATDDMGVVRQGLAHDKASVRILAAQTLQFLPCQEMTAELIDAAEHNEEPAVRLYAVDALGTLGGKDARAALPRLQQTEENRDVKRHIVYALERRPGSPVASVVDSLRDWDVQQLDVARVGEMAPDFSLTPLSGETVALSSFRSRKSVALVFLYGDT